MKKIPATVIIIMLVALIAVSCSADKEKHMYTCPMHPQVLQDSPGSCPICGMDLVPVEEQKESSAQGEGMEGSDMENQHEGHTSVVISPEKQQLINVKFDEAKKRVLSGFVTASGTVAYDPELFSAASEYRNAMKIKSAELKETAALKLKSLGLSQKQIDEISAGTEGGDIFNSTFVYAQVYQDDIQKVRNGAEAIITTGQSRYDARVKGIDPVMNPETRTFRVRIKLNSDATVLKPEMYVDVKISTGGQKLLSVPEEAVMNTGSSSLVFVHAGNGHMEPRYVTTGMTAEGFTAIKTGVKEGETVVVNGNFLIDSESQLKAALSNMGAGHNHDK